MLPLTYIGERLKNLSLLNCRSMQNLIDAGTQTWEILEQFSSREQTAREHFEASLSSEDIVLVSPLPAPKSVRDGYAFRQHVEAARKGRGLPMIPEYDLFPTFYFTNAQNITGPGAVPIHKRAFEKLDFELEIACVIGKAGKNIPANKGDHHIFGFMIMNDWSARALQREEMALNLGPAKGKDFASSFGPYLVTPASLHSNTEPSKFGAKYRLNMKAWHNQELVSEGNVVDMTWTFGQILERVSLGVWLEPGEIIASGTVGTGCFMELNVTGKFQERWIRPNDTMTLSIEHLGTLHNQVVEADEVYQSC